MLIIVPSLACPFTRSMCSNRAARFVRQGARQALLNVAYASPSSCATRAKIRSKVIASDRASPGSNLPGSPGR